MLSIKTLWEKIEATVNERLTDGYIISLPVISYRNSQVINCFVLSMPDNGKNYVRKPTQWVRVNINDDTIVLYDCEVKDFCTRISNNATFKPYLCKEWGIDALNDCLKALTELTVQSISDDDIFSATQVNINDTDVERYNQLVLSHTCNEYISIYLSLMQV